MPRRSKGLARLPGCLLLVVALAVLAFAVGALLVFQGPHRLARLVRSGVAGMTHPADSPAETTRRLSRAIREGLRAAGVPADSIHDTVMEKGPAALAWRAGVPAERSLLQANYAVSRRIEEAGGRVLTGRERPGPHGSTIVTMLVGAGGHATHELTLVRSPRPATARQQGPARIAVVVYGFKDAADAGAFFPVAAPFAVALPPGWPGTPALFRAARAAGRETVLHLPLEPINYPQVNPGPGTVLVSLPPARITGLTRRDLDLAAPVVAVANHMGSLATQDMTVMTAVFTELQRRHLPFIHVQPVPGAVCHALAAKMGVVYDSPGAVIDAEARPGHEKALQRAWLEALAKARERGSVMVWVRATPATRAWLPRALSLKALGGVHPAPLSTVIRRPAEL
jgi:polysaccharide deacetylase 2 family uncharacterized protein YibQ